jgi:hypothetical protein
VKTTRATLLLVVVEQVTADEAPSAAPAIETQGEVILARPIRKIATTDTSARLAQSLDGLGRWLSKVAS